MFRQLFVSTWMINTKVLRANKKKWEAKCAAAKAADAFGEITDIRFLIEHNEAQKKTDADEKTSMSRRRTF